MTETPRQMPCIEWGVLLDECQCPPIGYDDRIDGRPSECVRLRESNEKLVKALEYYRDQWDWEPGEPGTNCFVPSCDLLDDRGEIARTAVANATKDRGNDK